MLSCSELQTALELLASGRGGDVECFTNCEEQPAFIARYQDYSTKRGIVSTLEGLDLQDVAMKFTLHASAGAVTSKVHNVYVLAGAVKRARGALTEAAEEAKKMKNGEGGAA